MLRATGELTLNDLPGDFRTTLISSLAREKPVDRASG